MNFRKRKFPIKIKNQEANGFLIFYPLRSFKQGLGDDFFFSVEKIVCSECRFEGFGAEAVDGRAETLLGVAILLVPEHDLFDHGRDLVGSVNGGKAGAHSLCLTPSTANENTASRFCGFRNSSEGTFAHANTALGALALVNDSLAVGHGNCARGAICGNKTFLASAADLAVEGEGLATLNADVVEARLHTAVGTAANADLEFVRKLDVAHTDIEFIVNDLCDSLSVDISENAGRALAGGDGTDLCARAAEIKSALGKESLGIGILS